MPVGLQGAICQPKEAASLPFVDQRVPVVGGVRWPARRAVTLENTAIIDAARTPRGHQAFIVTAAANGLHMRVCHVLSPS